jgi:hypothetical protein
MQAIIGNDLLGCGLGADYKTLDHLLRTASPMVKEHIYALINVLAAFQEGRKYLLAKNDLLEMLICDITGLTP